MTTTTTTQVTTQPPSLTLHLRSKPLTREDKVRALEQKIQKSNEFSQMAKEGARKILETSSADAAITKLFLYIIGPALEQGAEVGDLFDEAAALYETEGCRKPLPEEIAKQEEGLTNELCARAATMQARVAGHVEQTYAELHEEVEKRHVDDELRQKTESLNAEISKYREDKARITANVQRVLKK